MDIDWIDSVDAVAHIADIHNGADWIGGYHTAEVIKCIQYSWTFYFDDKR